MIVERLRCGEQHIIRKAFVFTKKDILRGLIIARTVGGVDRGCNV